MNESNLHKLISLTALIVAASAAAAQIDDDEEVVFFPTAANLEETSGLWQVPIHGWIFEPEPDSILRNLTIATLAYSLNLPSDSRENSVFLRRARWLLVDNERAHQVSVQLADETVVLDPSASDGHFHAQLTIAESVLCAGKESRGCQDRTLPFTAIMPADDARKLSGSIRLVPPRGLAVISDIDDTVKVSGVIETKQLLRSTFLEEFQIVPGMPELYRKWCDLGAAIFYVSSSPWQLYPELAQAFARADLPIDEIHLRDFRWKDDRFLNLMKSSTVTKPPAIRAILDRFPGRRFLLVGDDGEHDPEIYGAIARERPEQIAGIFIRDVRGLEADDPRWKKAFADVPPAKWQIFRDPAEIKFGRK